jgi:hypothetical protein
MLCFRRVGFYARTGTCKRSTCLSSSPLFDTGFPRADRLPQDGQSVGALDRRPMQDWIAREEKEAEGLLSFISTRYCTTVDTTFVVNSCFHVDDAGDMRSRLSQERHATQKINDSQLPAANSKSFLFGWRSFFGVNGHLASPSIS